MATPSKAPLVWIDCEMTGLDPDMDSIMQIACLITDDQLQLLDEKGWDAVIHQPSTKLDQMDEWCTKTHAATGLTEACLASSITPSEAATGLLDYMKKYVPASGAALLAGNSIHADRAFLAKEPYHTIIEHLHYRIFDVSSIKEAARRWAPEEVLRQVPPKRGLHEAKSDILESIDEARFYRETFFQRPRQ
ncbi:MAG: hypothetical protein M1823_000859 [Watsoniomyces obsoletus]|nr:MAG: hypothetical protein M1823_000859 [Watsoniomyces obsoletus]